MQTKPTIMFKQLTVALAATLLLAGTADAASLLDTGTPNGSTFGGTVDTADFLALQFNASSAWQIDGIAAFLTGGNAGDHFAVSLYQDAASHLPGDLLASAKVDFSADGWNGVAGLGWQLPSAGLYWLAVEGTTLEAVPGLPMPDGAFVAPSGGLSMPGPTAFAAGGAYQAAPLQFGLQVTGVVPEPTSALMLALGLIGVAVAARRKSI